ncbi:MAG: glycerol-3-phosphate dehydrogenase/oxidase [Chloroflexota bacterium]
MSKEQLTNRSRLLEHFRANPHIDVLIVGGGINGIGTFRDLALQGVNVLLVERGDFCSGASAASSHMVHGGIRYLENGEFRLVSEAVKERNRLIENAPHYVYPLPTTIPIFNRFSGMLNAPLKFLGWLDKPSERGAVVIKLGLMMYDAYTSEQGTVPAHRFEGRTRSLARYPLLNPKIRYTATYYDAAMHSPERIALESLLDGMTASSTANALNYVSALPSEAGQASKDGSKTDIENETEDGSSDSRVLLRDELSGDTFSVAPKLVINAAGPWIDFANWALGEQTKLIGGTKGSHLVLDHPELREAIGESELFFENKDGRIVLIYPFKERIIVGTSDIAIDNPDDARCSEEEINYFLEMISIVFPSIQVEPSHIVFQFSGVRPLPASNANTTGQISRDHSIQVIEPNENRSYPIYNLIGGKWTTFRAFSEQTTDKALAHLKVERQQSTEMLPIGGGRGYPKSVAERESWIAQWVGRTELPPQILQNLFERYGTRAADVAEYIADAQSQTTTPDSLVQTCIGSHLYRGEVQFLMSQEAVCHLDDLILRRTLVAMQGQVSSSLLNELADIGVDVYGWSPVQRQAEIERTVAILADRHGVTLV